MTPHERTLSLPEQLMSLIDDGSLQGCDFQFLYTRSTGGDTDVLGALDDLVAAGRLVRDEFPVDPAWNAAHLHLLDGRYYEWSVPQ